MAGRRKADEVRIRTPADDSLRMTRTRHVLLRVMVLLASGSFGLVLAEIGLRLFVPVTDIPFYFWDPVVGPRRAPDQEGRYVRGAEINAPYHLNSQGWNHPEDYSTVKPPGTLRVCVVGDSYVEALQVPYEQSFFALAQQRMSRPDRPVQWYAFGCSGSGTAQEYLVIGHYVLDYNPDVVVILFMSNDLFDCSPYLARQEPYGARFTLDDQGELVLTPAVRWEPLFHRRLLARSALVRYLYVQRGLFGGHQRGGGQRRTHVREAIAAGGGVAEAYRGLSLEQRGRRTWELIEAILARAQRECADHRAVLALAWRGSRRRTAAAAAGTTYTPPPKEADPYCVAERSDEIGREFLGPITRRLGIPYLDLTEALIATEREMGRRHFWVDDGHYNEVGHAAAAEAMVEWVEELWATRKQAARPES